MKEKSIIESLVNQIGDMLQIIQNHDRPIAPHITPEVIAKLEFLERQMSQFKQAQENSFREAGVDIQQLRTKTFGSKLISPRFLQVLERAQHMEREAKEMQKVYLQLLEEAQNKALSKHSKDSLQALKERRKRYKPMGGDKKWMPI